jgi:hypothetical protein
MVLIEFRTPPAVLSLMEGGGPELIISFEQIWTALNPALKSTVHNGFRTPPSVLPLTEGGGSGIKNKERADLNGYHTSAPIDGSWSFPGPPWYSVFNQRGGGVRNEDLFHAGPLLHMARFDWSMSHVHHMLSDTLTSPSTESTCPTCVWV